MSKKKTKPLPPKFPHYWMCWDCAEKMGGVFPDGHCCTCLASATCEYCGAKEVQTVPWVDFNWPADEAKNRAAKLGRD